MTTAFENSIFSTIIKKRAVSASAPLAILGGVSGSNFSPTSFLKDVPIVVFDFETTGLDPKSCRIIEIGAIRFENRKEVARVSYLVNPGFPIPAEVTRINNITDADVAGKPSIEYVLPELHDLMRGAVGVAHNADFDVGFLVHESARLGIQCSYHVLCTLKMARALVKSERKNLDALAQHFDLQFESRHRSIGDILVTAEVLWRMLDDNLKFKTLHDVEAFRQEMLPVN